jgi:hypothetical protein
MTLDRHQRVSLRALAISLAIGLAASAARADGRVVQWGLGIDPVPDAVNGQAGTASAIAAGSFHACAIQSGTGIVVCWGDDTFGQTTPPGSVTGVAGTAEAIAASGTLTCAIQAGSHAVVCWGQDSFGLPLVLPPAEVNGNLGSASAFAVGSHAMCAIQTGTDAVFCASYSGVNLPDPLAPARAVAASDSLCIGFGGCSSASVCEIRRDDGAVRCAGAAPPASVDGTSGTAASLSMGGAFGRTCAIQAGTGAVVCWNAPDPPDLVNGVAGTAIGVDVGHTQACAVQAGTGAVVCWGTGPAPPPSVDGTAGRASAVSVGGGVVVGTNFDLALRVVAPDADGDDVDDDLDDCPHVADPGQSDVGGVGSGSGPDGIGDACQCGDVSGDGRVTLVDAVLIQRSLLQPPTATLEEPERCDVNGDANCSLADAVILRRGLLHPPTAVIAQSCAPAMP